MAGSVLKVGKKFRVTLESGTDKNGKRLREFQTFATEAEAEQVLTEHKFNKQRSLFVKSSEMSLMEFLEIWMNNYVKRNCEETTIYGYRNIIYKHIAPFLGNTELQKLEPSQIQSFYNHLLDDKQLSPNTVRRHHDLLRKALEHALKQQFVYRNVADAVSPPKMKKFTGKSYTIKQLNTLFNMVKDTKLELPITLAGYLGLRREEIVGLKWEYVDLEERLLRVEEVRTTAGSKVVTKAPKTEKSRRSLYITDELNTMLRKHRDRQNKYKEALGADYVDSGYVVVRDDGKPYRVNSVTEHFKEFLEKHNLPKIRLHDLRHTFASILHSQRVDIKSISEALGHSDIGTTSRIYTHLFDKTHKETVSAMSRALKN